MSRIAKLMTSLWSRIRPLVSCCKTPITRKNSNDVNEDKNTPQEIEQFRFVLDNHRNEICSKLDIDHFGKKCGYGGTSEVYEGFNSDGTLFALKVQSSDGQEINAWLEKVMNEIRLLEQFQHENVVKMFDYVFLCEFKSNMYSVIKFEYLNTSLYNYLVVSEKGFLTFEQSINLAKQISSVIGWMHRQGVANHDIKCPNLMFNADLSKPISHQLEDVTYKIIDFGFAVKYNQTEEDTIEGGFVGGTEFYNSPEKWSKKSYDPFNSDSYSVAVTLLQATMGIQRLNSVLKYIWNFENVLTIFVALIKLRNKPGFNIEHLKLFGLDVTSDPTKRTSMSTFNSETNQKQLAEGKDHSIAIAKAFGNFKELLQTEESTKNDLEYLEMLKKLLSHDPSQRISMEYFNGRLQQFDA